jgi:hypothetical protein
LANIVFTHTCIHFMLQTLKLAHTIINEQGQKIGCDV